MIKLCKDLQVGDIVRTWRGDEKIAPIEPFEPVERWKYQYPNGCLILNFEGRGGLYGISCDREDSIFLVKENALVA